MTKNVDLLLLTEMHTEDCMESQLDNVECLNLHECIDALCGVDPETGEMDPDSGLYFPQPIE